MHMCNVLFIGMDDIVRGIFSDFSLHFRLSKLKIREEGPFSSVSASVCKLFFTLTIQFDYIFRRGL